MDSIQIPYFSHLQTTSPQGNIPKKWGMAVRKLHIEKEVIYFITFTCYSWLPLFEITKAYDSVYNWFEYMKKYENKLVGYVIMPNRLHLLLYLSEKSPNINPLISNGKRFLAYEIVRRLEAINELKALGQLSHAVKCHEKKHGKKHRVFEPSFDAKVCNTKKFILQKLHYIHRNPVSGKWNLVDDWVHYPHSSAGQYELGLSGGFKVTDFRDLG